MFRCFIIPLILSFYLLQAIMPAGYMPVDVSLGQGWMQLCPSGLTSAQMAWLHGDQPSLDSSPQIATPHHHPIHGHAHESALPSIDKAPSPHSSHHHDHAQWHNTCDYGALNAASAEAVFEPVSFISVAALQQWRSNLIATSAIIAARRRRQMQRAPPFLF